MDSIVIIGSGLAGYSVAREIRRVSPEQRITMLTEDSGDYYSKPALSNALARGKTPDQLVLTSASAMAKELNLELIPNARFTAIYGDEHVIESTAGRRTYSELVLAQGATPIRLTTPGDGAGDVISVNNLSDYRQLRDLISDARSILIIGAGLIGCEFANDLLHQGIEPIVVDPSNLPLSRLLPRRAGERVTEELARSGVVWRLGTTVSSIHKGEDGYVVKLSDHSDLTVDLVLSAVGLQPRTVTAAQAGLLVNHGIVVNQFCQSSDPDIYAIGDCAEYQGGAVLPYVAPILAASKAIARTICIKPTPFILPAMPVSIKLTSHPVSIYNPNPDSSVSWDVDDSEFGLKMQARDTTGRLRGFVLTGECTQEQSGFIKEVSTLPRA